MTCGAVVDLVHPDVRAVREWAAQRRWMAWHLGPAGEPPVAFAATCQATDREFVITVRGAGSGEAAAWCAADVLFEQGLCPQRVIWFCEGSTVSITAAVESAAPRQQHRDLTRVVGLELPAAWAFPELRDGRWIAEMRTP